MWAPDDLPDDILRNLENDIQFVLATPDLQTLFDKMGAETMSMTSSDFAKLVASEIESMKDLVKEAGIITE